MAEVLEHAAEQGATTLWLHVETDNAPARTFYQRLGLVTHHTCRYLTAPAAPAVQL
jgi:ribosomal protein S18 acetylase RimI-like enzyme